MTDRTRPSRVRGGSTGGDDGAAAPSSHALRVTGAAAFAVATMSWMQLSSIPLLPVLPKVFDSSIAEVSWVATAPLIAGAAVNPVVGRMGDMYGKRRLLTACLAAAIVGSLICFVADDLYVVILGRALQGLGAGVIALAYGMIRDEVASAGVARSMSVVTAAGAGVGAGLGPLCLGAVMSAHGWRSVFVVVGALSIVALGLVLWCTPGSSVRHPARFDVTGALVLTTVLVVALLGITKGAAWGWTSPRVLGLGVAAVCLGGWWTRWERRCEDPLIDLAVTGERSVLLAHLGGVMVGFATFAQFITSFALVTLPADVPHGLGRSAAMAGLVQVPGAAAFAVAVAVGTRASRARGARSVLLASTATIVVSSSAAFVWHGSLLDVLVTTVLINAGIGLGYCSLPLLILDHVHSSQTAAANAVSALARVLGSVLASAIVTAIMATGAVLVAGEERPAEWAFMAAYAVSIAPALAVASLAWLQRRRPVRLAVAA